MDYDVDMRVATLTQGMNRFLDFNKQTNRPPVELKKCYDGAASQFHILHNAPLSSLRQGHIKRTRVSNWDDYLPRDNSIYKISETMNMKGEDRVMKERFNTRREIKRAVSSLSMIN